MNAVQVSARVSPELKQAFEKKVKDYGLSMNSFITIFMKMVIQGKLNLEFSFDNELRTADLEKAYQAGMEEHHKGTTIDLETFMKQT